MKVERWESMYTTPSFMLCNHQVHNFFCLKIKGKKILATTNTKNTNTEHFQL